MPSLKLVSLLLFLCISRAQAETSTLWGVQGERWAADSPLPDVSFAGYRAGREPIPQLPVKINVKDFGAVGDGAADDTDAFIKAIAAVNEGALWIPTGRYKITRMLKITKGRIVLRGDGAGKTVLFFPKSLTEALGSGKSHAPSESWSWSGAFLTFEGDNAEDLLTSVTLPVQRGSRELTVSSLAEMAPGDNIRLLQSDRDGTLGRALYGGQATVTSGFRKKTLIDFPSRIRSLRGNTLILDRPLRMPVKLAWKPLIYSDSPTVQDVGLEELKLEFPPVAYAGHHEEPGFNAVEFTRVANSWIRNVTIVNADSGIILREGTKFCTLEGIHLTSTKGRNRTGYGKDTGEPQDVDVMGHHGILVTGLSQDNLINGFRIDGRFVHDLSVENLAAGNVFSVGQGTDLSFDHHRRAPYENLFTDIDAGKGTRLWEYGGDETDGPPGGIRETFWNIRAKDGEALPAWALKANFIGVAAHAPRQFPAGNWVEEIPPARLSPANLYSAQKARR